MRPYRAGPSRAQIVRGMPPRAAECQTLMRYEFVEGTTIGYLTEALTCTGRTLILVRCRPHRAGPRAPTVRGMPPRAAECQTLMCCEVLLIEQLTEYLTGCSLAGGYDPTVSGPCMKTAYNGHTLYARKLAPLHPPPPAALLHVEYGGKVWQAPLRC